MQKKFHAKDLKKVRYQYLLCLSKVFSWSHSPGNQYCAYLPGFQLNHLSFSCINNQEKLSHNKDENQT